MRQSDSRPVWRMRYGAAVMHRLEFDSKCVYISYAVNSRACIPCVFELFIHIRTMKSSVAIETRGLWLHCSILHQ